MLMDRNIPANNGGGKYAVINLRKLREHLANPDAAPNAVAIERAMTMLEMAGVLEKGNVGAEDEFFLVKLKDRHSRPALAAYSDSIHPTDPEFAREVEDMMLRAGTNSPWCKEPD